MSENNQENSGPREVACSYCGSLPQQPCRMKDGTPYPGDNHHAARSRAFMASLRAVAQAKQETK